MPLPAPQISRTPRHTRSIVAQAFERGDGLWDIDAHITDTKPRIVELASGQRAPNEPIHDLWLRITIDTQLNIINAEAVSDAAECSSATGAVATSSDAESSAVARRCRRGTKL